MTIQCEGCFSLNNTIATEPFKTDAVEKHNVKSGFATAKQKVELAALKVIFGTEGIPAGSYVYVPGDQCVQPYARAVFEVEGDKVIFVPLDQIKLVKKKG